MGRRSDYQKRSYTVETRAWTLLAVECNRGNYQRTARALGLPEPTVRAWAKERRGHKRLAEVQTVYDQKKQELLVGMREVMSLIIGELKTPKRLKEASTTQLAVTFGILFDKVQLVEGKPTNITAKQVPPDPEGALRALSELVASRGLQLVPIPGGPADTGAASPAGHLGERVDEQGGVETCQSPWQSGLPS
jgi:hypothetical protein